MEYRFPIPKLLLSNGYGILPARTVFGRLVSIEQNRVRVLERRRLESAMDIAHRQTGALAQIVYEYAETTGDIWMFELP